MSKDAMGTIITLGVVGAAAWALYEWLQSSGCASGGPLQQASPPLNWLCALPGLTPSASAAPSGGTSCIGPPWYTPASCAAINGIFGTPAASCGAPAGSGYCTPGSVPAGSAPIAVPTTTATLSNVTAPGQPFAAGDSFQLVVTGPPNSQVTGTASQNGALTSSKNFGTTGANGQLVITGGWDSTDVGSWVESWQVGSASPAPLSFTIAASGGVSGLRGSINRIPAYLIHRGGVA